VLSPVLALALLALAPLHKDTRGFAGVCMTSFGPLRLAVAGKRVSGTCGWSDEARLTGELAKNKRLEYEWTGPGGARRGRIELWTDGATFTGEHAVDGEAPESWGGYRREARAAVPRRGKVTSGQSASGLNYHLRVPRDFDPERPAERYTAVALFHGSNSTALDYVEGFPGNWPELAERYIVVGFDGERLSGASRDGARRFNATYVEFSGHGVGEPWRANQTPWLVAQALDELAEELPIERWFVGGHSQGGFLTLAVAMFYPQRVAGAFEVAGNLLVQCEPERFTDAAVRAAQRRIPIAIVHGRADTVVEFSAATYTHEALQDGGFPLLRLFDPPRAGHPWAFLPVDEALVWLEALASDDPAALVAFARAALAEERWRDATGALGRAETLVGDDVELRAEIAAHVAEVAAAAAPGAARLAADIAADSGAGWVDAFWDFRARFAFAPAARDVLAAYERLRDAHEAPAAERFWRARGLPDGAEKKALYREIVADYYASSFYRLVKPWAE
jgi:predicted esterase